MCGIIGYLGPNNAKNIVVNGLRKLEYRGYDSVGVAIVQDTEVKVFKNPGTIDQLLPSIDIEKSNKAIGHTRWATHGEPSKINAHPHQSSDGAITIVHNGVIENTDEIKEKFLRDIKFKSETDSEVIVELIAHFNRTYSVLESMTRASKIMKGSYAILAFKNDAADKMYGMKNKSPLLIGIGEDEIFFTSDPTAVGSKIKDYVDLPDLSFFVANEDGLVIQDVKGKKINPTILEFDVSDELSELGIYDSFMEKEIEEQADVIRLITNTYLTKDKTTVDPAIEKVITKAERIHIIAAGTSYHAGLLAKYYFEKNMSIPTEVFVSSEYAYGDPLIKKGTILIAISQSGETADVLAAIDSVKGKVTNVIAVTNTKNSTLERIADFTIPTLAGKEVSVAATKTFTAQVVTMFIMSCIGNKTAITGLTELLISVQDIISRKDEIKEFAVSHLEKAKSCFFIGRQLDVPITYESALKLKEISYIRAEGYASGEFKHGTISLIEKGTPVVAFISQKSTADIARSNIIELESRGAKSVTVVTKDLAKEEDTFVINKIDPLLAPVAMAVVGQYIALYATIARNLNVDRPRNLAKSVTVE